MTRPERNKPRNKRPYRDIKIPKYRPNGHNWLDEELLVLDEYKRELIRMSATAWETVNMESKRSLFLQKAGWTECMPGLWCKSFIGPYKSRKAELHESQSRLMFRSLEK